jgi:energy-converting hydrogenase Eha subunit F
MCEPGDTGLKGKGHELRTNLALKRITYAGIISAALILFIGFLHGRLPIVAFWLGVLAIAALALSVYCGTTVVERTARSMRMNDDWPVEREVAGVAFMQRGFICLGVLLTLVALITAVYLPPNLVRPVRTNPQPTMQPQTPMRPMNPRGGAPDVQPAPTPEGGAQRGRLERQPPRSQRDQGNQRNPAPPQPPAPPEGG